MHDMGGGKELQRICEATYQHLGFGVQSRASSELGLDLAPPVALGKGRKAELDQN